MKGCEGLGMGMARAREEIGADAGRDKRKEGRLGGGGGVESDL